MFLKKKRFLIPLLLVGLLVVVLLVGFIFLDTIAKTAIETVGSNMMGVPTTVDSVSLSPFGGSAGVKGLTIGNPPGYETPHFMAIGSAGSAFKLGDLTADTITVDQIRVDGMSVNLEKKEGGDSNYEVILENMKKGEEQEEPPPDEPGKRFVVKEVVLTDIRVRADLVVAGKPVEEITLKISEIRLEDVGSDTEGGALASQLMGTIVKATLQAIVTQGADVLPGAIVGTLKVGLEGLGKLGVKGVRVVGEAGGKAVDVVGGAAKGIGDAVGGLFGGKKDEEKKK